MKFGVIGYGNLGKTLIKGMLFTGVSEEDIVINKSYEKCKKIV